MVLTRKQRIKLQKKAHKEIDDNPKTKKKGSIKK